MSVWIRAAAVSTLFILSFLSQANAQSPPAGNGGIRGRVVDAASRAPISGASVDVVPAGTAAAVASTLTGADGGFRIRELPPGRYRARIRSIGYGPKEVTGIAITAGAADFDLRTVTLAVSAVELPPVQVVAPEQAIQLAPDRDTYVVRDLPTTRGGTALDVLRNVPSVDVDIDNIVSLRGNAGVVVQINGRPSPLKAAQLGNFLAQLPADMVDKVEVVTNPSARENPEGVAGIINIILKRKPDGTSSAAVTVGGSTRGHADIGGNAGVQRGPFSVYGSYGFFRENRPRSDSLLRENLYLDPATFLDETGTRTQTQRGHTFTVTAGYQVAEHDELSLENLFTTRSEVEARSILYRELNAARDPTGLSDRVTSGTNHQIELESTLGWEHAFAAERHSLRSELRVVREQEDGPQAVLARTLGAIAPDTTARESVTNLDHAAETSLKLDYVRPLSAHLQLEAGYQGSLQRLHTALGTTVFDPAEGAFAPDSSRISDFTYNQTVNAVYGMLDAQPGRFLLQAGARVEHAATRFHLLTLGATYDNGYSSVFPSALVAYNVDELHQVKLSYSTRIRRPDDTDLLDPTPHYSDPLNLSIGNPSLKPEYIRAFELGLQRRAGHMTIQVTPFFRHTLDAVRTLQTIDTLGVTTRTFANVATSDAYGTDATLALNGGRLSGFASTSLFRQVTNAPDLGAGFSVRTFGWSVRANASFRVSSALDWQALLSYQSPRNVEQGRNGGRTRFSFAARQKLRTDRMNVTLRVIDPFNTSSESSSITDPAFTQVSVRRRPIRALQLNVTWMFGQAPRKSQSPGDLLGPDQS